MFITTEVSNSSINGLTDDRDILELPVTDSEPSTATPAIPFNIERGSALFLMRVSDELSLTHNGIDKLCSATQWFIDSVSDSIADKVQQHLSQSGISICENDIKEVCHPGEVFGKLSSRYYRESYYESAFHYVVNKNIK